MPVDGDDFFGDLDSLKDSLEEKKEALPSSSSFWKTFYDLSTLLNTHIGKFEEVLYAVAQAAFVLTDADRVFLYLLNEEGELYSHLALDQEGHKIPPEEQQISQTILETVLEKEEGLFLSNVENSDEFSDALSIQELKILSAMCVPLKVEEKSDKTLSPFLRKIMGLLYVDSQSIAPSFDEEKLGVLQMLANLSTSAILHSHYYEESTKDPRSGAFSRRHFEVLLKEALDFSRRTSETFCLSMMDIDGFRKINEKEGYSEGDRVINEVAEICRRDLSEGDLLARYGGDEFALLLQEKALEKGQRMAEKILRDLEEFLSPWKVKPSMGLAQSLPEQESPMSIKRKAVQALTRAKNEGGGRLICWREDLGEISPQADKLAGIFVGDASQDYRNILALMETIGDVNSTLDLEELLHLIVDRIIELSGADRGILVLPSEGEETLPIPSEEGMLFGIRIARDREKRELSKEEQEFSHSILLRVLRGRTPICISDTLGPDEQDLISPSIIELQLRSIMAFPLQVKDRIIGALYIDGKSTNPQFGPDQLPFFTALGHQMSIAIENAHLFEENLKKQKQLAILNKKLEKKVEVQAHELIDVREELKNQRAELEERYRFGNIIGKSPKMQEIYRTLEKLADSDVPVLIYGESGTGKELIARAIHFNSRRKDRNIVSENCAAVNEQLLESELFGHVKGAFTGADQNRKGLFELAERGSLFLDEIGDMSLGMQKKLLRVLQEKELRRVGDNKKIPVDVRIISATNRDLKELISQGVFRQDLYYRINVLTIYLPPLRERKGDLPFLVEHFVKKHTPPELPAIPEIPREVLQTFLQYSWPGNIRELENEISKLMALGDNKIEGEMISPHIREERTATPPLSRAFSPALKTLKELEKDAILATLQDTGGNKQEAAKRLGITRKTLYNKMSAYKID